MKNYSKISLLILFLSALQPNLFGNPPTKKYTQLTSTQINALREHVVINCLQEFHKYSNETIKTLQSAINNRSQEAQQTDSGHVCTVGTSDEVRVTLYLEGFKQYCLYASMPQTIFAKLTAESSTVL